jgi:hypothetical protein
MSPVEESRKFDVHACKAGMNIKFPGFSCGSRSGDSPPEGGATWRVLRIAAIADNALHRDEKCTSTVLHI